MLLHFINFLTTFQLLLVFLLRFFVFNFSKGCFFKFTILATHPLYLKERDSLKGFLRVQVEHKYFFNFIFFSYLSILYLLAIRK